MQQGCILVYAICSPKQGGKPNPLVLGERKSSQALMAMPFEKGKTLMESLVEVEALWVLAAKDSVRVEATKGFPFKLQ